MSDVTLPADVLADPPLAVIPRGKRISYAATRATGLACVYFAVGMHGLLLAFGFGRTQIIWSSTGIAFAGLALFGIRFWPAIALADALLSLAAGYPLLAGLGITTGKVLEACLAVYLYQRYSGRRLNFRSVADVFAFVVAAGLSSLLGAGFGTLSMVFGGAELPVSPVRVWGNWAIGDLVSDLILAPFILNIAGAPWRHWKRSRIAEGVGLFVIIALVGYVVFTQKIVVDELLIPFTFPLFPLMIWAALRFEQTGAAAASLLISLLCLFAEARGTASFDQSQYNRALLTIQAYMFVITISSYCLGAAVTARRDADMQARKANDELRALSQKLDVTREEERIHLAREIHDQLGQQLTGLDLAVAALVRRLPADAEPAREKAREMHDILQETIGTVQRIAMELRPGVITQLSLGESLQWLAEKFTRDSAMPVTFRNDVSQLAVSEQCKTVIFRIFQEAFSNLARHSQASTALLEIRTSGGRVSISLQDDGVGVPAEARTSPCSLGFIGMRERAHDCGAELRIESAPFLGSPERPGTMVSIKLPA